MGGRNEGQVEMERVEVDTFERSLGSLFSVEGDRVVVRLTHPPLNTDLTDSLFPFPCVCAWIVAINLWVVMVGIISGS
jgi:hypothetical protein